MKRYEIYNDLHLFGPHEISEHDLLSVDANAIFLGDNVDINHVKYKHLDAAIDYLRKCKKRFGQRFVPGNHELDAVEGNDVYIDSGICFTHGDFLFWGLLKSKKYRTSKKPGAGWLSRNMIVASLDSFRKIIPAFYKRSFKERCVQMANLYNCHTVVCGHKHPTKAATIYYKSIKIIVLPRGKNILNL